MRLKLKLWCWEKFTAILSEDELLIYLISHLVPPVRSTSVRNFQEAFKFLSVFAPHGHGESTGVSFDDMMSMLFSRLARKAKNMTDFKAFWKA